MAGSELTAGQDLRPGAGRAAPALPYVLSVGEFIALANQQLRNLGEAAVEGEISDARISKQHLYFKLKDERATLSCAVFANVLRTLPFKPESGMQVVVHGWADIYAAYGNFSLKVKSISPTGQGKILEQLRALEAKLAREGVFDRLQRSVPRFVGRVGIITSPAGSVQHDMLTTLKNRNPLIEVVLYPAQVQGVDAPWSLIEALHLAYANRECDVLIIGRGGGSFEELLAFSNEEVVRTVAHSPLPIISAVGHDPDTPLTDRAADLRASTPTRAAELVSSVTRSDLLAMLAALAERLHQASAGRIVQFRADVERLSARLEAAGPGRTLNQLDLRLEQLCNRLHSQMALLLSEVRERFLNAERTVLQNSPEYQVQRAAQSLDSLNQRLTSALERLRDRARQRLENQLDRLDASLDVTLRRYTERLQNLDRRIEHSGVPERFNALCTRHAALRARIIALNPLGILDRGYSYTMYADSHRALDDHVAAGQRIITQLAWGEVSSVVEQVSTRTHAPQALPPLADAG